jgi:hypothetical protein
VGHNAARIDPVTHGTVVRAGLPIELQDGSELAIPGAFAEQPKAFSNVMLSGGWMVLRTAERDPAQYVSRW